MRYDAAYLRLKPQPPDHARGRPASLHRPPASLRVNPPSPAPVRALAVILAAGLGTRMKSARPKILHPLCGRPMLAYVVDAAAEVTGRAAGRRLLAGHERGP